MMVNLKSSLSMQAQSFTVHVTGNLTISADSPRGFSADHLQNPRRFSAEFLKDFCGSIKGYPLNRQKLKGGIVIAAMYVWRVYAYV